MKDFIRKIKNICWICSPLWKYGKLYIILCVCVLGLFSPIDDIIYVRFPEIIIDLLSNKQPFSFVAKIAILICTVTFINNAIPILAKGYFAKKRVEIELKVNRDIYKKASQLDYKYVDNSSYYDSYSWAVDEYAQQVDKGRELIVSFFQCALSLVALGSIIVSLGPWILILEAVQMVLHAKINQYVNTAAIKQKEELVPLNRRIKYVHRLFYMKNHAEDIRSTPLSSKVLDDFAEVGNEKVNVVKKTASRLGLLSCLHEMILSATELIVILYLIGSIVDGRIPEVGMYMTLLLSFYRLDSKIDVLTKLMKEASILSMNAERIKSFFEIESTIETQNTGCIPEDGNFSVDLKDVYFSYESSQFSLSGLSLHIGPGEKIAIVGENGAGKSTFVKLLMRLYDVDKGEIYYNGTSIREYDVHALRQRIGVAFQNTNVYAMTLADNISLYGEVSDQSMRCAAQSVGLDSVLEKNAANFNVELTREFSEDGLMLSGGEVQKVALARIMAGDFGLIILDEPSAALDPIAEYKMSRAILSAANKATTIMVAHRLSTIRDADKIVVIDNGMICEYGTHGELMEMGGKYYEMFTKQAEKYKN